MDKNNITLGVCPRGAHAQSDVQLNMLLFLSNYLSRGVLPGCGRTEDAVISEISWVELQKISKFLSDAPLQLSRNKGLPK